MSNKNWILFSLVIILLVVIIYNQDREYNKISLVDQIHLKEIERKKSVKIQNYLESLDKKTLIKMRQNLIDNKYSTKIFDNTLKKHNIDLKGD